MNFNFVETHIFTKLDILLDIYFSFASRLFRPWNYCLKILTKNSIAFVYKTSGPGSIP